MSSALFSPYLKVATCVQEFLLSPLLSGSLLLAITYAETLRGVVPACAQTCAALDWLQASYLTHSICITKFLWWHLVLATLRRFNQVLNVMASNSWNCRASLCCTRLCRRRDNKDLHDEVAVITGGSSGIGKRLVEKMTRLGVNVAVLDIQDLPKSLETEPRVRFYRCDVSKSESVMEAADAVRRELGHPSILINNAGIARDAPILETTDDFLHKIFGVNCLALWHTTKQFLPNMIQQNKGHVITVASLASFVALPTAADYSATKAGALAFHESLTSELRHCYKAPNVLTTVVHPNFVRTPLIEHLADRLERSGINMLTSDHVADDIIASLRSRKGGQVVVPKHMSMVSGLRAWPGWVQHLVRDVLGQRAAQG